MTSFSIPADKATIARLAAKMLLEIQAVHFTSGKPFIFTSGWASPVYTDCRKIISYPRLRAGLMDFACATMLRDVGYEQFDVVANYTRLDSKNRSNPTELAMIYQPRHSANATLNWRPVEVEKKK